MKFSAMSHSLSQKGLSQSLAWLLQRSLLIDDFIPWVTQERTVSMLLGVAIDFGVPIEATFNAKVNGRLMLKLM